MKKYLLVLWIVLFYGFCAGGLFAQEKNTTGFDEWGAFGVNMIFGLGLGSFAQGDEAGGLAALAGELAGVTLILVGATWPETTEGEDTRRVNFVNFKLVLPGAALWLGSRIYSVFRPLNYARGRDRRASRDTQTASAVPAETSFSAVPVVSKAGRLGLAAAGRVRF